MNRFSRHAAAEPAFFRQPVRDSGFDDFYSRILDDPEQFLVLACIDNKAVGHVQFLMGQRPQDLYRPERRFAYINQLAVSKDCRRTGCGMVMIEHVKAEAADRGIELVGIDFWSFNAAARACFDKAGFKVRQEHLWLRL